jgi:16S rRNA (guanine(966)-N(2))-methyltransferase RsmD
MRIVAGRFRGRTLQGPTGAGVRPTSDGLRETLFNVIGDRVAGANVLDAFAGTGAVGLEALSRGADHATFVEQDRHATAVIRQNVASCGAGGLSKVVQGGMPAALARLADPSRFDVVFLDPPYDLDRLDELVMAASRALAPGGLLILEHSRRRETPESAGSLIRSRLLVAGDSALSFYVRPPAADTIGALDR